MTKPENTTKRDPLMHLAGSLGGVGRYVEEMEAAGQSELVNSDRLPTKFNDYDLKDPQKAYEALGFGFGEPDPGDPMFREATLPKGWSRQGSSHSMWSHIVDELGRKRVSIFYKAAWYDRDAFMSLTTVASCASDVLHGEVSEPIFDDAWCTPEAFAAALRKIREGRAEYLPLYEGREDQHASERHAELVAEIAKIDDLIKRYA